MNKKILNVLGACLMLAIVPPAVSGCAAVLAALPTVIAAVVDAMQVLDAIEHFINTYFAVHPDQSGKQKALEESLAKTKTALNAALRTCTGAQKLDQQQVDSAFKDFKAAYIELATLLGDYGMAMQGDQLRVTPGADMIVIPSPIVMTLHVEGK